MMTMDYCTRAKDDVQLNPITRVYGNKTGGPRWTSGFASQEDHWYFGLRRPREVFGVPSANVPLVAPKEELPCAFYAGVAFPYYGHFLIESLSALPNFPGGNYPIIFHTLQGTRKSWHDFFFSLAGLSSNIYLLRDQPIKVGRLMHLEGENIINANISAKFVRWCQALGNTIPRRFNSTDVYISRKYCLNAQVHGEEEVESIVRDRGWTILYPEKTPISDQISMLRSAERVIAVEGSALHSLMFCDQPCEVHVIARRKVFGHNFRLQFARQKNVRYSIWKVSSRLADSYIGESQIDVELFMKYFRSL